MHRVRQLILAGTQPPDCFVPATEQIAQEMTTANAIVLYHSASDYRDFVRIQRDFATMRPPWGKHAAAVHNLRAFG